MPTPDPPTPTHVLVSIRVHATDHRLCRVDCPHRRVYMSATTDCTLFGALGLTSSRTGTSMRHDRCVAASAESTAAELLKARERIAELEAASIEIVLAHNDLLIIRSQKNERIAELERENASLRSSAFVCFQCEGTPVVQGYCEECKI